MIRPSLADELSSFGSSAPSSCSNGENQLSPSWSSGQRAGPPATRRPARQRQDAAAVLATARIRQGLDSATPTRQILLPCDESSAFTLLRCKEHRLKARIHFNRLKRARTVNPFERSTTTVTSGHQPVWLPPRKQLLSTEEGLRPHSACKVVSAVRSYDGRRGCWLAFSVHDAAKLLMHLHPAGMSWSFGREGNYLNHDLRIAAAGSYLAGWSTRTVRCTLIASRYQ